jgi:hypothetical protein
MEDLMKEPVQFLLSKDGLSFMPTLTSVKNIVIPSLNLHGLHAKFESIIETPQLLCLMDSLTSCYLFDSQVDLFKNINPQFKNIFPTFFLLLMFTLPLGTIVGWKNLINN